MSKPERVSEGTRARVKEAVRATGYTLNQAASSLRKRGTKTILVALPNVSNPFFSPILGAVERVAAARGYGVLVANCTPGKNDTPRLQEYFRSNRADGLLLLDGTMDRDYLQGLFPDPDYLPIVVACEEIPDAGLFTVKTNNDESAAQATEHLIGLGHMRIAFISGPQGNILSREREQGFRQAMQQANLEVPTEYIAHGDFTIEGGMEATGVLLSLETPPTAVFCADDETALGVISAARNMGISCPQDISVVGFDDIEVASHYMPPLTTISQPKPELGRIAIEALLDMLENDSAQQVPSRIILRSELVIRESTAPPSDI